MSRRVARVAEALQETVAGLVQRDIKDPRVGMVTITRVSVSPDLRNASVYFSRLGSEEERMRSLEGLRSAAGFVRSQVARRLQLRVAPQIRFELDDNPEYAERMAKALRDVDVPDSGDE